MASVSFVLEISIACSFFRGQDRMGVMTLAVGKSGAFLLQVKLLSGVNE